MSDGPVHKEKKQGERLVGAGINAALRFDWQDGDRADAAAQMSSGRREGAYISAGLPGSETEAERPPGRPGTSAAALHQAYEAACDPASAGGPGFVGPCSLGLSVFGAPPLQFKAEGVCGAPQAVPAGGPASWARRTGMQRSEIGPPPAHPLSVASPLGLGVAGGAWNAPDPLREGGRPQAPADPAEAVPLRGSEQRGDGPAGSPVAAVGDAWSELWG